MLQRRADPGDILQLVQERPLLVVVSKKEVSVTRDELLAHFAGKVARWQIPDDVVFVESLPHTATGKLLKTELREKFGGRLAVTG